MSVGRNNDNLIDNTVFEFSRPGFWLIHTLGVAAVFFLGMRFAVRRAPLSIMAYRILRMLNP